MEQSNRRGFLRGLASLPLIAGPIGAAANSETVPLPPAVAESPELLALGRELDVAVLAYEEAEKRKSAAVELYRSLCPPIPDELVLSREDRNLFEYEDERDLDGNRVWQAGVPPRRITNTRILKEDMEVYSSRSKLGRIVRKRLRVAEEHERKEQDARARSDLDQVTEEHYFAQNRVERVALKFRDVPATTLAGCALKARAILACGSMGVEHRHRSLMLCGGDLAETLLALQPSA